MLDLSSKQMEALWREKVEERGDAALAAATCIGRSFGPNVGVSIAYCLPNGEITGGAAAGATGGGTGWMKFSSIPDNEVVFLLAETLFLKTGPTARDRFVPRAFPVAHSGLALIEVLAAVIAAVLHIWTNPRNIPGFLLHR